LQGGFLRFQLAELTNFLYNEYWFARKMKAVARIAKRINRTKKGKLIMGFELLTVVPFIIWFYLRYRQDKMVRNTAKELAEKGSVYYGQLREGKPRIMVVVAVNDKGEVLDARLIQFLRLIKPAEMYDLPELIGKRLDTIIPSKMTTDVEMREVMNILINSYVNATDGKRAEKSVHRVTSKCAVKRPNLKK